MVPGTSAFRPHAANGSVVLILVSDNEAETQLAGARRSVWSAALLREGKVLLDARSL